MIEKLKAVNNPLTIIAIFAALAEIAGTAALATVDKPLQVTFVWFVMGFPVLLVILFFATLNFNPKVLYAPSDFKNEDNFLGLLMGTRNVSNGLEQVTQQLEHAKKSIVDQVVHQITAVSENEREKLNTILSHELIGIETSLQAVRKEAKVAEMSVTSSTFTETTFDARVLEILRLAKRGLPCEEIAYLVNESDKATYDALSRLIDRSLVGYSDLSGLPEKYFAVVSKTDATNA